MAKNCITLRIYVPTETADLMPVDKDSKPVQYLEMSVGSNKTEGYVACDLSSQGVAKPQVLKTSIQNVSFTKKMYQPNVITVELYLTHNTSNINDSTAKVLPKKEQIIKTFLNKKVEMFCDEDSKLSVCNDYYVQMIEPRYTKSELYVMLTIYSPDYQLTIDSYCRAFVAKRLSTILDEQKANFSIPYLTTYKAEVDKDGNPTGKTVVVKKSPVAIDHANMQHVVKEKKEHIFPYLVQYNESYYDFLKRTTNRWGEFLYYENGKLNVGFDSTAKAKKITDFYCRTYCAIDAKAAMENGTGMHTQATADKNMLDNPMTKGEYDVVKAQVNSLADGDLGRDKYIMSKIASLFGNNKSLATWTINTAIDDLVALGIAELKSNKKNEDFEKKYFKDEDVNAKRDQYDADKKKFNQFSEFTPLLGAADYGKILKMELSAGREAMKIDFQTSFPDLKLGEIINVAGEDYLVVEFRGYQPSEATICYEATCLAKSKIDGKNSAFFPPYLESGHIRVSGVQHATVTDAGDPLRANRVRVKFGWQGEKDDATPWLLFAQDAATKSAGVHGRHYKDEQVLVDFVNGNVERPYVIGAVNQKTPAPLKTSSITMMSPAGHGLRVADGTGAGLGAFVASVTPGAKMIQGMFPGKDFISSIFELGKEGQEISRRFEGSSELCDYYGIYSIKGSTDSRNITIKSPWGDVKINAFTGITVSAPNGDIKLQGKNVTIEAGNNLKLISGSNVKNKFISRASSNSGESLVSAMADVPLIVAKKLQDLAMNICDLSLIRNILEVGFKPQEGLLEIQSNRFLKLEAGGAKAGYPLNAYASQAKLEKEHKKKAKNTLKMAPAIVELLGKIDPCVDDLIQNYAQLYETCCDKKAEFQQSLNKLQIYSNSDHGFCHGYDDLKALLWNKDTKEIKESDMGFNDQDVGTADNAYISARCRQTGRNNFPTMRIRTDERVKNFILGKRKDYRAAVLKSANALLKSIQDFRKVRLMNYQQTYDVGYYFGTFTRFVPKDYIGAFKNALKVDRLKGTYYYDELFRDNAEGLKTLEPVMSITITNRSHILALKRKVALNLMEDWGIKDQKAPILPPDPPVQPLTAPQTEAQLLGNHYTNYVGNLTINEGKIIEKDSALIGNLVDDFLNKIDPSRPIREYYSWGSPKDGAILFSDKSTYQLGGQRNTPIETKFGGGKFKRADLGDGAERKVEDFMTPIRAALRTLGIAPQRAEIIIEEENDDDLLE